MENLLRSPYATRQLGAALAHDLKLLWRLLFVTAPARLARAPFPVKAALAILISLAILLPVYLATKPAINSFIARYAPVPAPAPEKANSAPCPQATCYELVVEDGAGKKATVQFRTLVENSYWKLGSKDRLISPTQGEFSLGMALDALYDQDPFENVQKVIAIGVASQGIKVSNKQEEILASQRASALLEQLRPILTDVDLYALNLGRYTGDKDDNRQRLPLMVLVFDSDPAINLESAILGALRSKRLFGLNIDLFSKAATATLRTSPAPR